jgi:two-component system OmpR family response regulator
MDAQPHLLLVDDHRDIRESLTAYLRKQGYRISTAENAAVARKVLTASAIDLVVLDIMMPGEDGLALCRSLRATTHVPIILLTAMTEDTDRVVGLEMGAVALSTVEFVLLSALLAHPQMVLSRDQLLDLTRGRDADVFDRSIDNQVSRLRKKIEADPKRPMLIKTHWGDGYSFTAEVRR